MKESVIYVELQIIPDTNTKRIEKKASNSDLLLTVYHTKIPSEIDSRIKDKKVLSITG